MTVLTLTTGSAFIMWLGEQISERGIGNGMSLIIFVGIVVGLPRAIYDLYEKVRTQAWGAFTPMAVLLLLALMIAVVAFIVYVEGAQRRIPVQYAKRVVGRRVMGGQATYLPLRVNSGGVIPPIFASSLLAFPATAALALGTRWPFLKGIADHLKWGEPLYTLIYVVMIIVFAFFYVGIVFNPTEACRQHAQERWVYSRHPPWAQYFGICQHHPEAVDVYRGHLFGAGLHSSRMDDCWYRVESSSPLARRRLV